MEIELQAIGKKFRNEWIFKDVNHRFLSGSRTAIVGSNGSGKSTLLKIIGTFLLPTRGKVQFINSGNSILQDDPQLQINFVAPYLNLIEELTLEELLTFHSQFKVARLDQSVILHEVKLPANKPISEFSSGMKQRVKLLLAFFYESDLLLLDEPTTNLDEMGMDWFQNLIISHQAQRTLLIASNLKEEYKLCDNQIKL